MALSEVTSIASARSKKADISLRYFVEYKRGPGTNLLTGGKMTTPRKCMGIFSVVMKFDILLPA